MERTSLSVLPEFSSSIPDFSGERKWSQECAEHGCHPWMLTAGPGEEGPGKSYLCQAWLWPLLQNEKWTIEGHCVSNQLSIIQGQILHSVGPPTAFEFSPAVCPLTVFLPIRASQRVGRWRQGEEVKFRSVISWLFLRHSCKRGRIVG
jgi:hypothetical protein